MTGNGLPAYGAAEVQDMNPDDMLLDRAKRFVRDQTGFPLQDISLDTRLRDDIGLAGDDAYEFFLAFAKEFEVDRKTFATFKIEKHFGNEGLSLLAPGCLILLLAVFVGGLGVYWVALAMILVGVVQLLRDFVGFRGRSQEAHGEITVKDLVDAAEAKKWKSAVERTGGQ
jgi:hypothetical protein